MQNNRASIKIVAPESESPSEWLFWVKIALSCGVALLLGGGIFMASRLGHALQFRAAGNETTIHTADGDWRVERPNETGPGLPVYPDAGLVLPGGNSPTVPKNKLSDAYAANYYSSDPSEFVVNWYTKHLGPEFARANSADQEISAILRDASIADNDITFVGERGDQIRIVAIATDANGTKITLVRSTKRTAR
jgi:hypothetical protein